MDAHTRMQLALFSFTTPISFTILSMLSIADIVFLSRVSRTSYQACKGYFGTVWSFRRFFRAWVSDTDAFQALLRDTSAVISGSQALQFLDRTYYPATDLDIFLRPDNLKQFISYLLQEGYCRDSEISPCIPKVGTDSSSHAPDPVQQAMFYFHSHSTHFMVYNFIRKSTQSLDGRGDEKEAKKHIQLIVTSRSPIIHILQDFHSTAVMNFITANRAVSVFPLYTLEDRITYRMDLPFQNVEAEAKWSAKYEGRGFRLVENGMRHLDHNRKWVRQVGDVHCLTVPMISTSDLCDNAASTVMEACLMDTEFSVMELRDPWTGIERLTISGVEP